MSDVHKLMQEVGDTVLQKTCVKLLGPSAIAEEKTLITDLLCAEYLLQSTGALQTIERYVTEFAEKLSNGGSWLENIVWTPEPISQENPFGFLGRYNITYRTPVKA